MTCDFNIHSDVNIGLLVIFDIKIAIRYLTDPMVTWSIRNGRNGSDAVSKHSGQSHQSPRHRPQYELRLLHAVIFWIDPAVSSDVLRNPRQRNIRNNKFSMRLTALPIRGNKTHRDVINQTIGHVTLSVMGMHGSSCDTVTGRIH